MAELEGGCEGSTGGGGGGGYSTNSCTRLFGMPEGTASPVSPEVYLARSSANRLLLLLRHTADQSEQCCRRYKRRKNRP